MTTAERVAEVDRALDKYWDDMAFTAPELWAMRLAELRSWLHGIVLEEDEVTDVLRDVVIERARQVEKGYTPEHDDAHTSGDFADFIQRRFGPNGPASAEQAMLEVAALAVACLESLRRKQDTSGG